MGIVVGAVPLSSLVDVSENAVVVIDVSRLVVVVLNSSELLPDVMIKNLEGGGSDVASAFVSSAAVVVKLLVTTS